ncbi:MAG: hypothetical protein AAGM04_13010, partial [Pseudomonadota bacterium]
LVFLRAANGFFDLTVVSLRSTPPMGRAVRPARSSPAPLRGLRFEGILEVRNFHFFVIKITVMKA